MFRNDFVSNSSSCSFIIHLVTTKDIDEFKKVFPKLIEKKYIDMDRLLDPDTFFECLSCQGNNGIDTLKRGDFVRLSSGDDHCPGYEQKYWDMCEIIDSCGYNFKMYKDSYAHMTRGKRWKDNDD